MGNFKVILSIVAGIVTLLVWLLNPKSVKERKLKKLRTFRDHLEKEMDLAKLEGREIDYNVLKTERDQVNKEISEIVG